MKITEIPGVKYRMAVETDIPFIVTCWKKETYNVFPNFLINDKIYYKHKAEEINELLKECKTIVAVSDTDPDQIFGFITFQQRLDMLLIHYIYIKNPVRNFGFGSNLIGIVTKEEFPNNPNILISELPRKNAKEFVEKYGLKYLPSKIKQGS